MVCGVGAAVREHDAVAAELRVVGGVPEVAAVRPEGELRTEGGGFVCRGQGFSGVRCREGRLRWRKRAPSCAKACRSCARQRPAAAAPKHLPPLVPTRARPPPQPWPRLPAPTSRPSSEASFLVSAWSAQSQMNPPCRRGQDSNASQYSRRLPVELPMLWEYSQSTTGRASRAASGVAAMAAIWDRRAYIGHITSVAGVREPPPCAPFDDACSCEGAELEGGAALGVGLERGRGAGRLHPNLVRWGECDARPKSLGWSATVWLSCMLTQGLGVRSQSPKTHCWQAARAASTKPATAGSPRVRAAARGPRAS